MVVDLRNVKISWIVTGIVLIKCILTRRLSKAGLIVGIVLAAAMDLELCMGNGKLTSQENLFEIDPVLVVLPLGRSFEIVQPEVGTTML